MTPADLLAFLRQRWPDIAYVRVRPRWARFSDYAVAPPRIEELTLS
jgi:hypothetical protein